MGMGFRNINYGAQLYNSLRNFFSVNAQTQLTLIFNFCAACLQPLVVPFAAYVTFRNQIWLVAQCAWEIGQLTNVLNMIYDATLKRIFITQAQIATTNADTFEYAAICQGSVFGSVAKAQVRAFGDLEETTLTTINVPTGLDMSALTATVNQIRLQGIPYQIVVT